MIADLDGAVHAMVGGRDYGDSQFNRAVDAMRQPGSSFKPYVYATALANGFKPSSVVVDSPVCIGNWCPHNYAGGFSGAVTLIEAITRSINVIPVKLSIALGDGNPKLGRAKIVQTARNFGIVTPLPDTPSLPIGADAVTPLEHAVAFATFPNLGRSVTPHAALEVRTGTGQLVWRFDRDGTPPKQVISPQVAIDMIRMMNSVVENGTGKRAALDGIPTCGKTGTTNDWRDGWFVGYTGNFVGAVWMGNDDFSPTKHMTGGTLPAMTWHDIMAYAHQGVELRHCPAWPPRSTFRSRPKDRSRAPTAASRYADAQSNRSPRSRRADARRSRSCACRAASPPARSVRSTPATTVTHTAATAARTRSRR